MRLSRISLFLVVASLVASCGDSAPARRGNPRDQQAVAGSSFKAAEAQVVSTTDAEPNKAQSTANLGVPLYQCNAWPLNGTYTLFYWINAVPEVAARNAVNVCWNRTRLPCTYSCFMIQQ